jgi:hypothetical protein
MKFQISQRALKLTIVATICVYLSGCQQVLDRLASDLKGPSALPVTNSEPDAIGTPEVATQTPSETSTDSTTKSVDHLPTSTQKKSPPKASTPQTSGPKNEPPSSKPQETKPSGAPNSPPVPASSKKRPEINTIQNIDEDGNPLTAMPSAKGVKAPRVIVDD